MQTEEIESTHWAEFCTQFNDKFRGTLVSLGEIGPDGSENLLARDLPLRALTFQKGPGCSDTLSVRLGRESDREFEHEIIEPIHLKVRQNNNGAKSLEIRSESGNFGITFHSGQMGELLKNLV
jgi:hypothetical protein